MIRKALMSILVILISLASAFASAEKPVFALVLSGGGARGLTHIPVIQELEKRGIVPDMVLGTSMGALVGGLYAAGYDGDALEEVALNENLQDAVYSMPPMRTVGTIRSAFDERPSNLLKVEIGDKGIGSQLGVLDDTKVNNLLMKLFSRVMVYDDFDDLPIPFRAIGTDVTNNRTVIFGSGSFFDAVRASMAFPVVFAPVILEDGSVVVDGGVTANLPVKIARELGADYILAVDCGDALGQYKDEDEAVPPETLTAVISQIIDTMLSADTASDALEADWLISPDYTGIATFDFSNVPGILERAEAVVASDEMQALFDEIEAVLGPYKEEKSYTHYDELPVHLISDIGYTGISDNYRSQLESFIGRPMDYDTLSELDALLERLRRHEGLENVSYRISGTRIHITGKAYPLLSGYMAMGLNGGIGVRFDGKDVFFAYTPRFSVQAQFSISQLLYATIGVSVSDSVFINSGLTIPVLDKSFFYLDLELKYGSSSSVSIPGTVTSAYGRDVGLCFRTGFGYVDANNLRVDSIFGFDYTYLSGSDTDMAKIPSINNIYPYFGLGFIYDIYDGGSASDDGFETELKVTIGGDLPENMFSYSIDWEFFGAYGPGDDVKFFAEGQASSVRRPWYLSSAYRVMTTGLKTADYLYLLLGVRVPLPSSAFLDIGAYAEGFSNQQRTASWVYDTDLIPMATINDYDIGGCLSGGIITSFGTIKATLYVSVNPRVSFMVEIE